MGLFKHTEEQDEHQIYSFHQDIKDKQDSSISASNSEQKLVSTQEDKTEQDTTDSSIFNNDYDKAAEVYKTAELTNSIKTNKKARWRTNRSDIKSISAPTSGTISDIYVHEGGLVNYGDAVVDINTRIGKLSITSAYKGIVRAINFDLGSKVDTDDSIVDIGLLPSSSRLDRLVAIGVVIIFIVAVFGKLSIVAVPLFLILNLCFGIADNIVGIALELIQHIK